MRGATRQVAASSCSQTSSTLLRRRRSLSVRDACLWAVGISSVGLDEVAYAKVTEELTLRWARAFLRLNPGVQLLLLLGRRRRRRNDVGSRTPRVEGGAQGDVFQALRLRATRFHPAGTRHSHPSEDLPSLHRSFPSALSRARLGRSWPGPPPPERLGRAMLRVVQGRADRFILESADINRIGA